MRIKIITIPTGFYAFNSYMPSLGIAYLSAYLKTLGFSVSITDLDKINQIDVLSKDKEYMNINQLKDYKNTDNIRKADPEIYKTYNYLISKIKIEDSDIIALSQSVYSSEPITRLIASFIKSDQGDVPIVVGGHFVDEFNYKHLKHKDIDFIVKGEGELAIEKITEFSEKQKTDTSKIPNLMIENKGIVNVNKAVSLKINEKPCPDFSEFNLELYRQTYNGHKVLVLPYDFIKGCPNRCSFCIYRANFCENLVGFESKNPEKIVSDIMQMKSEYGSFYFSFGNNTLNVSKEYLINFADLLIKEKADIMWSDMARPTGITKSVSDKLFRSGCKYLTVGIESGSDRVLKAMNKNFTIKQVSDSIRNISGSGIFVNAYLIVGYIYESLKDQEQTVNFLKKNIKYIDECSINVFRLYKGSHIFENPEKYNITNIKQTAQGINQFSFDESLGHEWYVKKEQQKVLREKAESFIKKRILFRYIKPFIYFLYSKLHDKTKVKEYLYKNKINEQEVNRSNNDLLFPSFEN